MWLAVAKMDGHSAADRRSRALDSPGETLPCTLMAPGARKIRRGCNVLQVPVQIIPLWVPKPSPPWRIKNCDGMSLDHPQG